MKTFIFKACLLLLLINLALTWYPEGRHSLVFLKTVLTGPDYVELQFFCDVYLDDILVERFSNKAETSRLELIAPRVGQQKPDYWEKETQIILKFMDLFKEILKKMIFILNQNEIGYHNMQIHTACDMLPGGSFSHGVSLSVLNDQEESLLLNQTSLVASGKAAEILKQELEDSGFSETMRTFLKGECVQLLLAHLDYGKEIFLKTDAPKMHVTHKVTDHGKITLKCWAVKFYPKEISLIWKSDGVKQVPHMEVIETRPAGDGTFQKWAAVEVISGEEQRYTCHVKHEGLHKPITVKWEPPESSVSIMPIIIGLVLGAVLMGAVVTFLICKEGIKATFNGYTISSK